MSEPADLGGIVRSAVAADSTTAIIDAVTRIDPNDLTPFFHPTFTPAPTGDDVTETVALTRGTPSSPGAATGRLALSSAEVLAAADRGEATILVRPETSPDDVAGMQAAAGIVTTRGGVASHAAVIARGWGIPAVVGATELEVSVDAVRIGDLTLRPGDLISIDGGTGDVFGQHLSTTNRQVTPEVTTLLGWADTICESRVAVLANADSKADAEKALSLGAQGIGLCRTEHQFLSPGRLGLMRSYILAADAESEAQALIALEQAQASDFEELLAAMDSKPITIRLLDAPLHEFLPDLIELKQAEAQDRLSDAQQAELVATRRLRETNPMVGTRGIRLAIVRFGLYEMQVRALCRAVASQLDQGRTPTVSIMIPLICDAAEMRLANTRISSVIDEYRTSTGRELPPIPLGAMIETPRAALTTETLAAEADFFSLGTNDLTQLTFGLSRDDTEVDLLPAYEAKGLLDGNPFLALDTEGVGPLLTMACTGHARRPSMPIGACGEHAGHPTSIRFLVGVGVDSLSCSPYRIPAARLAAAQALIAHHQIEPDSLVFGPSNDPARTVSDDMNPTDPGSPDEALLLHVLAIRGYTTADGISASLGQAVPTVLASLLDADLVRHIEARDLYGLTPAGKVRYEELFESLSTDEARSALRQPYQQRFLALNVALKELCSSWQVRHGEPNDHGDASYDRHCIEQLVSLNTRTAPVLSEFALLEPRFDRYRTRLEAAAAAVKAGDESRFTGVMKESFHDIWMELHEDLIRVLGIDRADEGSFDLTTPFAPTGTSPITPVVELQGVGRVFDSTPPVEALRPTNLVIDPNDYVAIVGPSGSGKSTLLHILGLLDTPSSGRYLLDGIDTSEMSEAERAGLRGSRVGFVFQSFHLLAHRTVVENVVLAELYASRSRRDRKDRAVAALEKVGLGHRLDAYPTTLSGGERQRVAVARALVGEPSLILADEPTGNLDSRTSETVMDMFEGLHATGITLAIITHDSEVAQRAHRRMSIRDGVVTVEAARRATPPPPQSPNAAR